MAVLCTPIVLSYQCLWYFTVMDSCSSQIKHELYTVVLHKFSAFMCGATLGVYPQACTYACLLCVGGEKTDIYNHYWAKSFVLATN